MTNRFLACARRCGGLAMTRVGELTAESGAWLRHLDGSRAPLPEGFEH
jgi:hypothetical protein